jgi:hypothetical protein
MHPDPLPQARVVKFARLVGFLLELVRSRFYGEIKIRFRGGSIMMVEKFETFTDDVPVKDERAVAIMETAGRL